MRNHLLSMSLFVLVIGFLSMDAGDTDPRGKSINRSLSHDGYERTFQLYVPAGHNEKKSSPLLIVLHGGGGSAKSAIRLTQGRFNKIADEEDLIVAYPEAVRRYWNEGRQGALSFAHRNEVDDAGFLRTMIEGLIEEYGVDANQIFMAGVSNGGFMAYRAACAMPDLVSGIATVNASIPQDVVPFCDTVAGVSLLMINGTEDPVVPYEGGTIMAFGIERGTVTSTDETIAFWLEKNQCPGHAEKNLLADSDPRDDTSIATYTYPGCDQKVKILLYRVEGGGHTWPGGRQYQREERVGRTSRDINACDEIWAFFQQMMP